MTTSRIKLREPYIPEPEPEKPVDDLLIVHGPAHNDGAFDNTTYIEVDGPQFVSGNYGFFNIGVSDTNTLGEILVTACQHMNNALLVRGLLQDLMEKNIIANYNYSTLPNTFDTFSHPTTDFSFRFVSNPNHEFQVNVYGVIN